LLPGIAIFSLMIQQVQVVVDPGPGRRGSRLPAVDALALVVNEVADSGAGAVAWRNVNFVRAQRALAVFGHCGRNTGSASPSIFANSSFLVLVLGLML
jgi:hypothetical protein